MIDERAGNWIRFSEETDVIASLSQWLRCLDALDNDPMAWKWVVISAHLALQGAMVCHLRSTDNFLILTDKSFRKVRDWHERDGKRQIDRTRETEYPGNDGIPAREQDKYPQQRLADFQTLLRRLTGRGGGLALSTPDAIALDKTTIRVLSRFHRTFRNNFAHFVPKGWSIEIRGMPQILLIVLGVIKKIVERRDAFRHLKVLERDLLTDLLAKIRSRLDALDQALAHGRPASGEMERAAGPDP